MPEEIDSSLLKFRQIPDAIRAFLVSGPVIAKRLELLKKHGLNNDQWFKLTGLLNDVYTRDIAITAFVGALSALGFVPEKAKEIALDYAGYEFLPISDHLGDVDALIRSLGGDPARYPPQRVAVRSLSPLNVVTELLHDHPVNVPAFLEHRLHEILETRVRGVRKDDETIARLTRAEKIGGVELPQAEAEQLVAELDSKIASVNIATDVEMPKQIEAQPQNVPPPTSSYSKGREEVATAKSIEAKPLQVTLRATSEASPLTSSKKGDGVTADDEREAEMVREKVLPMIVPASLFDLDKEIKAAVEVVFARYGVALPRDIQERFRTIVVSRLKGVRVTADTREILGREPAKGGMGFGPGLADDITSEIEKQDNLINNKRAETMNKEKAVFSKTSALNAATKDESRKKGEQDEVDRLYGSLTAKRGRVEVKPREPQPGAVLPLRPEASPLPVSPKMHDVRVPSVPAPAAAKLTGPIEELRNITVADFRRLSAEPVEACRKLSDKLDLLQEQSYARRIEGIKAWQGSEVQKMYLDILTASFGGGKPIAAAIADAQAAGKPTLTEREVHAIMEFNRGLKA